MEKLTDRFVRQSGLLPQAKVAATAATGFEPAICRLTVASISKRVANIETPRHAANSSLRSPRCCRVRQTLTFCRQ